MTKGTSSKAPKQDMKQSKLMSKNNEPEINVGWMRMNLNLSMYDWNYCNTSVLMKKDDTVFHIIEIIKRIHPRCQNIRVTKESLSNAIDDVFLKLGDLYNTQGRGSPDTALTYQIYYDFDQGFNCPLLLF